MEKSKCLLAIFLLQLAPSLAQVYPMKYSLDTPASSVNGSNITSFCSNSLATTNCTSSVVLDGHIPTLTGLDSDMWASQLLTIQNQESQFTFDFTNTPDFQRVERVEVAMFNCPQWGIGVQTIMILGDDGSTLAVENIGEPTSCDSLIKVCIPVITTDPVLTVRFHLAENTDWLHLAEVSFYGGSSLCPVRQQVLVTSPPPPPAAETTATTTETVHTTQEGTEADATTENTPLAHTHVRPETTTSDPATPTLCPLCRDCPSCSTSVATATIITAIITALLATVIFVLVQITVCRHFLRRIEEERARDIPLPQNAPGHAENTTDNEVEEHTYMEVANGTSVIAVKENEAYACSYQASSNIQHQYENFGGTLTSVGSTPSSWNFP